MDVDENRAAILFVQNACQYYATARFAMHAQCIPVCGNMFHHAVEMLLKSGLAKKNTPAELRALSHSLEKIWLVFKTTFPNSDLNRHDATISLLHEFENIRYPDNILKFGMMTTGRWSGPIQDAMAGGVIASAKSYKIVVSDIDQLFADAFGAASWNPLAFMPTNAAALEAVQRQNDLKSFFYPAQGNSL